MSSLVLYGTCILLRYQRTNVLLCMLDHKHVRSLLDAARTTVGVALYEGVHDPSHGGRKDTTFLLQLAAFSAWR